MRHLGSMDVLTLRPELRGSLLRLTQVKINSSYMLTIVR